MKKNNCIVFGGTSDQVFAVACVMMDLKRLCSKWVDEVVYFHDGLDKKQQELLNSILPCRCIDYNFPAIDSSCFNQQTLSWFSKMVFSKFECLRLLDEYQNVIWLDYDIVIQADLSELTIHSESGIKMMPAGITVREQLHQAVSEFDMAADGMSAGTFVFQDHLAHYKEMYNFCYKKMVQYAHALNYPEQAIFDFMIQAFNLKVDRLDPIEYAPHPRDGNANSKILHAYGYPKFWNGIINHQWELNYQEWLRIGGSRYRPKSRFVQKIRGLIKKIIGG